MLKARARFVFAVFSAGWMGCEHGCAQDRPYTPYVVEAGAKLFADAEATDLDSARDEAVAARDDAAVVRSASQRPSAADATSLSLDGLEIRAPEGERIVIGLAADLDGDSEKDAVAWVSGAEGASGRLLFYRGDAQGKLAPPKQLAQLPTLFPEGCTAEISLEQVGQRTVSVQAAATCAEPLAVGTPARWVAVASPAAEPSLRQAITVRKSPEGERLSVEIDATDRDGDGRDDLLVRFALEGAPAPFESGPRMTADVRWFDRPAGLSRDADEPESSLRTQATLQMVRAERKKEVASVSAATRQLRRLYSAICEEGGGSLASLSTGPLRCGTSRALEDAVLAEIRAANTLGEPLRALAAIERFSQWPTSQTSGRRKEAERIVRKLVPVVQVDAPRALHAKPVRMAAPSWSPLAFDRDGSLLILTQDGVVRAGLDGEEVVSDTEEAWPLPITSPDGRTRWISSLDPCDGLMHRLSLVDPSETVLEVPLPLLPPPLDRGRCPSQVTSIAMGRTASGTIEALIAGEPYLLKLDPAAFEAKPLGESALSSTPTARGSGKSPDGGALAIGTRGGVLVRQASKWRFWSVEGAADTSFEACTASNGAQAVACLRGGKAIVLAAPAKAAK